MIRYLLSFLFLLLTFYSYAQPGKFFSVDTELSSSLISEVHQDKSGVIWIATEDGLNRYDGSKFTIYKQNINATNSLLSNFMRLIFEDSKGHLFLGFYNGLQLYNDTTGKFTEIPLVLENGEPFSAHVITMLERKNGEILVGTAGHGLFSVKFVDGKAYANQTMEYISSYFVNYLYEDKNQNLWMSTSDQGLFRLTKDNILEDFSSSKELLSSRISSMVEDTAENLYLGSINKGLFSFDETTKSFVSLTAPDAPHLPVNTLYRSQEGLIYIGTEGKGIKTFHPASKKISDYNIHVSSIDFSKVKISSIIEDQSGNIWAGVYQKGVALLPSTTSNFKYIGYQSAKDNIIGSNIVSAIYKDHDGILWIGTDGDGLYGIWPDGKNVTHYPPTSQSISVPATIMSIYEDSNHDLWLGSYNQGMARFDKKSGKCTYVSSLLEKDGHHAQHVFSFQEDSNKRLWIGSMGSGLSSMSLTTGKITRYMAVKGTEYTTVANILHNDWINCLLLTSNEKLYIGTFDGLGCYDIKSKSFVSTYGVNRLLSGEVIYSLYEDHQGNLWIGTSKGLKSIKKRFNGNFFVHHGRRAAK